ncbi:hypothetical protein MCAP1_000350 [Malassezia caprae]|uniref:Major facilitator superfamily (MFS) profile domain-containing protein n=1 Tax=Malassezia caprae TaxID=1381934 RepID=A0AAF0E660_9BASI|nr:hypothetical protein MCAP1_000350 [Malassezia caprae]
MAPSSLDLEKSESGSESRFTPLSSLDKPDVSTVRDLLDSTPSDELVRKTVRKLDLILMPLMCGCMFLQTSDKTLLNSVSLLNFRSDVHLKNNEQLSWIYSIFWIGYLIGTFIHARFIQRCPLGTYVAGVVVLWGGIAACHAACHTYSAFLAVRFFLGFMEAALPPSFILLTGRFYTRHEQVIRTSFWYSMYGVAGIVAGAATYSELVHPPTTMAMWQSLYLIYGIVTMAFGVLCLFLMPSSPSTTKFLNEDQRRAAVYHIAANQSGIHDTSFKWYQVREALLDIRLYIYFLAFASLCIVNGGIYTFGNLIIQSFHYDDKQSALLSMTLGGGMVVCIWLGLLGFYLLKRQDIVTIASLLVAIVGGIMMVALPVANKAGRMAGTCAALTTGYALVSFFMLPAPVLYSWQSTSVSGTTKRIVFNVGLQLGSSVGNVRGRRGLTTQLIGPHPYDNNFRVGEYVTIVFLCVCALSIVAVSVIHHFMNYQRDRRMSAQDAALDDSGQLAMDLSDLTDKERPTYRYPY